MLSLPISILGFMWKVFIIKRFPSQYFSPRLCLILVAFDEHSILVDLTQSKSYLSDIISCGSMVDAPLMAGPAEAEAGILEIVVGGDQEDFERLSPLFECFCRSYKHVGEIGNGHLAKLAINFCGLSSALIFAQAFPISL